MLRTSEKSKAGAETGIEASRKVLNPMNIIFQGTTLYL